MLKKNGFLAVLVGLILVIAVFPDVIFREASLRVTDQYLGANQGYQSQPTYSFSNDRQWYESHIDTGGSVFQSDPMIEFMKYNIQNGESPYWNPYSAAGSLGPEALTDQKFSFFTLVVALFGGSSSVFNTALVLLYFAAVICVFLIGRDYFDFSILGSVSMAIFYLLNGYNVANFGSNVSQGYLYVPLILLAAFHFTSKPSGRSFVWATLSIAMILSCTFLPTTIVALLTTISISIAYVVFRYPSWAFRVKLVGLYACAHIVAFACTSSIYLPIAENIGSLGTLKEYTQREFYSLSWLALPSLLTPMHFFESYYSGVLAAGMPGGKDYLSISGNTAFHFGLFAFCLALFGIPSIFKQRNKFFVGCLLVFVFGLMRLFDFPVVSKVISFLPIVGNLGAQYLWGFLVFPLMFLIGKGFDSIRDGSFKYWPVVVFLCTCVSSLGVLYYRYGFTEPRIVQKEQSLTVLAFLVLCILVIPWLIYRSKRASVRLGLTFIFVSLMFASLLRENNSVRYPQSNYFSKGDDVIHFVQKNNDHGRILNMGDLGIYPELSTAFRVPGITTMVQGVGPEFREYYASAVQLDPGQSWTIFPTLGHIQDTPELNKIDFEKLNFLGLRYILIYDRFTKYKEVLQEHGYKKVFDGTVGDKVAVFENSDPFPRAFSLDLDSTEIEQYDFSDLSRRNVRPVQISAYHNASVALKGAVDKAQWVILTDNWHQNWMATVNGNAAKIFKARKAFRAVWVPRGEFEIHMSYRPKTLTLALGLTILAFLLLSGVFVFDQKIRKFFVKN